MPGRIRTNVNVDTGSDIYYNIRRPILRYLNNESLDSLIEKLRNGNEKLIKISKPNDILIIIFLSFFIIILILFKKKFN